MPHLYSFRSLQETISTCRFAQRVALIKNEAVLNEELDPKLVSVLAVWVTVSMPWSML